MYTYRNPLPATISRYTPGFWARASTGRKVAYVAGATAAVTGTVLLVRWLTRPEPFREVAPQCNNFVFGDRTELNDAIAPLVKKAAKEGAVDPFAVTTDFVRKYASQCQPYPQTARNPGEAKLYVSSFVEVLRVMAEQNLVSPQQQHYYLEMVAVWGQAQGLAPMDLPFIPPQTATETPVEVVV